MTVPPGNPGAARHLSLADPDIDSEERRAELASLRETVTEVCDKLGGTSVARRLRADGPGFDERAWEILSAEVGLAPLGLPEAAGGVGGLAELLTVAEVLGAHLLPVPLLSSTVLAGQVLAAIGDAAADALARVAEGQVTTLAATDAEGLWRPDHLQVTFAAMDDGDTVILDGVAPFVLDGPGAGAVVVAARPEDGGGPDLFWIDLLAAAGNPGVRVERLETLDLTRAQAMITFTDAVGVRLTQGGTAGMMIEHALDVAGVVLAAEQLGGAQACLDLTVAYIKDRRQFGRPIGGFQAVKHTCADLLVLVEMSRSAVDRALNMVGTPGFGEASAVAQAWCSDAFRTVSAETVQLHGGIGFTWEHDAHLYFRRARADAVLLGGAAHHRERIASLLGW